MVSFVHASPIHFEPKFLSRPTFDKVPNTSVLFLECFVQISRSGDVVRHEFLAPCQQLSTGSTFDVTPSLPGDRSRGMMRKESDWTPHSYAGLLMYQAQLWANIPPYISWQYRYCGKFPLHSWHRLQRNDRCLITSRPHSV